MPGKHGIMKSGAISIDTRAEQKSLDQYRGNRAAAWSSIIIIFMMKKRNVR